MAVVKVGTKRRATPAKGTDILDEMTRGELLAWVRDQLMGIPKRSQLLYLRWKMQSAQLQCDWAEEMRRYDAINGAGADRLEALVDHMRRTKALDARERRIDRLYAQIDVERLKEYRA